MGRAEQGDKNMLPLAAFIVDSKGRVTETARSRRRFAIDAENLELFLLLKATLPDVQKQFPFIKGVGFFGSRTKGKTRSTDSEMPSDIDICLFSDSSEEPANPFSTPVCVDDKTQFNKALAWDTKHG